MKPKFHFKKLGKGEKETISAAAYLFIAFFIFALISAPSILACDETMWIPAPPFESVCVYCPDGEPFCQTNSTLSIECTSAYTPGSYQIEGEDCYTCSDNSQVCMPYCTSINSVTDPECPPGEYCVTYQGVPGALCPNGNGNGYSFDVQLYAEPTSGDWPLTVNFEAGYTHNFPDRSGDGHMLDFGDGTKSCSSSWYDYPCDYPWPLSSDPCVVLPVPYDGWRNCYFLNHTYNSPGTYNTQYAVIDTETSTWWSTIVPITVTGEPPSIGHIRVWHNGGVIKLNLINATEAISRGLGVVKVARFNGDINSAADLVDSSDPNFNNYPVRIFLKGSVKAWRTLP